MTPSKITMNLGKFDGTEVKVWWNVCVHCGGEIPSHGLYVGAIEKCRCGEIAMSGDVLLKGWQCPFCKTVYSPYKDACMCQLEDER